MQSSGEAAGAKRWFVVHTLPSREFGAQKQLEFQGYETFLPLHLKTVRHARQFRTMKAPFFPRYLFVSLDLTRDRWRSVNGTFGVSSLIMEGDRPKPVPHGVTESLAGFTGSEGLLSFAPLMQPPQKVRVLTGPLANSVGELIEADEQGRVRILLEIMGSPLVVRVNARTLAPIS
jgi:transcriptional antiterminator RfaH